MSWSKVIARPAVEVFYPPGKESMSTNSLDRITGLSAFSNGNVSPTRKIISGTEPSSPTSLTSPSDNNSRIPRPSPTALRRSASMRIRGERISPSSSSHHLRPTTGSTSNPVLLGHQHHRSHQQQQSSPYSDHRIFPVITENGTESPRQRSFSLSLTPARPRQKSVAVRGNVIDDSDTESIKSYGSACSTASACDHASFAANGTTWSGRSRKYIVHCSNYKDNEEYLTPTQRAARQVRKLESSLKDARREINDKNQEIFRLTKEVVELRLYKASLNSPDEKTDSSDALTVRENNPFSPESPTKDLPDEGSFQKSTTTPSANQELLEKPIVVVQSNLPSSLADSGHFEDGSVHSKDSICIPKVADESTTTIPSSPNQANATSDNSISSCTFTRTILETSNRDEERRRLVDHYENRIEEMHRRHIDEIQDLKEKHNNKVESLLNQLSELNTQYYQTRPSLDEAEKRTRELESELDIVKTELAEQKIIFHEQEERNKQMYLKMYAKGQEAANIEQANQIVQQEDNQAESKFSVNNLHQQLTITQAELENIKDTNYSPEPHISAERRPCLLSAQEAVSLWFLATRKAKYRRIVESRSSQGTMDHEITLQFLKRAIYYFLIDKENSHGHLNAIESILEFTDTEKINIDKIYRSTRK